MSNNMKYNLSCIIQNCKQNFYNKAPGVTFHPLPTNREMRSRWLSILKTRCTSIDWNKSKICSKHFDNKCFDPMRKLRDNSIPTMFSSSGFPMQKVVQTARELGPQHRNYEIFTTVSYYGDTGHLLYDDKFNKSATTPINRTKVDRLMNRYSQQELHDDIKNTMIVIKTPENLSDFVNDNLQCEPNSPVEAQLWLLIKKQDHLITRLEQQSLQSKKHIEVLQNNMEEYKTEKKEMEQAIENYKYIAKCLQEKQATLEEQIEILTAVESR